MLVKAKKSLGQNFLRSEGALLDIVKCSDLKKDELVIEIGPGEGVLTERILETGANVLAIEKDDRLIEVLKEKFEKKNFQVLHQDVKDFDFEKIEGGYKVIANIPYYLTGLILRKLIDANNAESLTLLVQKEVALRATSTQKQNLLSLSINSYGQAKLIRTVPRGSFVPSPKVDSAIIHIKKHSKNIFSNEAERQHFFTLIHAGFAHKRKTLGHNLNILNNSIDWAKYIDVKKRAEDVHFEDWLRLAHDTLK